MVELDLQEFLKAEDIGVENNVKILDEGKVGVIRGGEGKPDVETFEIGVIVPMGDKKVWTMNKTSQRTLATAWGKITNKWIGKTATLFTTKMNVMGTDKDVIFARIPKQ